MSSSEAAENLLKFDTLNTNDQRQNSIMYADLLPDSLASLLPMFDVQPVNHTLNPNITISYKYIFGFERLFESHDYADAVKQWMQRNWTYSFLFSAIYILFILIGRRVMATREKFELRKPLLVWNLTLAVFSLIGTIRVWPEFLYALFNKGVVYSVCDGSYAYSITGFWAFMFIMSKLPELIDTLFIVLRKQELIFLHWYHHCTVLVYCWYSYKDFAASGRWFMNMNYFVHSLMYSYFALKSMKVRVPIWVSKLITSLQLVQMVFGCYVNWVAYTAKQSSPDSCQISDSNVFYSFLMYFSYFGLFFQFFLDSYIKANAKKAAKRNGTTNGHATANGENDHKKNGHKKSD